MDRHATTRQIAESSEEPWDVVVIGGGATGLGTALDAAARGYRTLLVEGGDFSRGTSSRSTKIIHGGVRYLRQGNIRLVRDSLRERGLLMKNCPELVTERHFVVPHYRWWERFFYGIGLWLYDRLAGKLRLSRSHRMSKAEIREKLPTLNPAKLRGGTVYADGQFDDARLAVAIACAVAEHGGAIANYLPVTGLLKSDGKVRGVTARDLETGREYEIRSRVVINATGVFSDAIRKMDDPESGTLMAPSQGIHLVLDRKFLPGEYALMIPKTDDGRLLFAIPWKGKTLAGTTDTAVEGAEEEPRPFDEEVEYMLAHLSRYLVPAPERKDILSTFAGLRPLVKPSGKSKASSTISRDHTIEISESGLVTIVGGKWTTFRKMAEDVIGRAAEAAGLPDRECKTKTLAISGSGLPEIPGGAEIDDAPIHPDLEITKAHVLGAVKNEMARNVEDVLARRTRALFLDAKASLEAAPVVAGIMAEELGRDDDWKSAQLESFRSVAQGYLPGQPEVSR